MSAVTAGGSSSTWRTSRNARAPTAVPVIRRGRARSPRKSRSGFMGCLFAECTDFRRDGERPQAAAFAPAGEDAHLLAFHDCFAGARDAVALHEALRAP